MKKFLMCSVVVVLLFAAVGSAKAETLIPQGASFGYTTLGFDLWANWSSIGYGSLNWENAVWNEGEAVFGNSGDKTLWQANTDLALTKTININGVVSNARLYAGVDNGFILFINGALVTRQNAEGGGGYWEYDIPVAESFFRTGENLVQLFLEDHGGGTWFDMQLTADINSVPVPGALLLFASGVAGLAAVRKKISNIFSA